EARLGCTAEERSVPQEIRVSVQFLFHNPPRGTISDDLRDTICYAKISEVIGEFISSKEYCLIEKLAADLHDVLKSVVEGRAEISLSVLKVRPPVENLLGGVDYRIGDFP